MVQTLSVDFSAVAADWESGAIAWTAARNDTKVLILRAVSDLVGAGGGELYDQGDFQLRAREVMLPLLRALPAWLNCAFEK
jgi:adenosylhomocysteine nucleosidase